MDRETILFLKDLAQSIEKTCNEFLAKAQKEEKPVIADPKPVPQADPTSQKLILLKDWNKHHDWPSPNSFKNIVFNRDRNGADYFIRKAGRRLLICEKSFFEWMNMSEEKRLENSAAMREYHAKFKRKW